VKALDPAFPRQALLLRQEPFWIDVYRKLYRLLKLQLIVCPASCFHRTESLLSSEPDFESLQDLYFHLSDGCRFHDDLTILQWQVIRHFRDYLQCTPDREPTLLVRDVVRGELEPWSEPNISMLERRFTRAEVEALRGQRLKLHESLIERFKVWQQDQCHFDVAVLEEAQALGRAIVQGFWNDITRHARAALVPGASLLLALHRPPLVGLVYEMTKLLGEYGVHDPATQIEKVSEYFQSTDLLRVPFVRLSGRLYASLARKAQAGQRVLPTEGTITDVHMIASLLPYCDAMFLDAEMAAYLREVPLRGECEHFETQIFSLRSVRGFLQLLDQIEEQAGRGYVAKIERVYGEPWLEPNMNLVEFDRARRRPSR
jgi:hypothetical protein